MAEEAPIVVTLKIAGGPDRPWIVLRSGTPEQAQQQLDAVAASGLADAIGRANAAVNAGFNAGNILGARTEAAPVAPQYAQPQQAPAPVPWENGPAPAFAQPQAAPVQQQTAYQPPAPQYAQPAPVPGAPMTPFGPAKLVKGTKNGRDWQAWADPRPKEATAGMVKTQDVNDPGLANGTASLFCFIH